MLSRRDLLWHSGGGLGGIALAAMLGAERLLADDAKTNHKPKAKRVVNSSWPAVRRTSISSTSSPNS
ncbi:MAG TPA: hypothetical protein VLM40_09785 [Gemmata sp.]|nr:hypothetical protein [Gemmata sp.]